MENPFVDQFQRNRALHGLLERIVAAGIEDHEPQLARAGNCGDQLLQRHGLRLRIAVGDEFGVDRDQIIDAADLHAMTGIIHHRPIGLFGLGAELVQGREELVAGQIRRQRHGRKTEVAKRGRDQFGIARRIGERLHVLVGAVADDQGDLAGAGRHGCGCFSRGRIGRG